MNHSKKKTMNPEMLEVMRRLQLIVADSGGCSFEDTGNAMLGTVISMVQFSGVPKAHFLENVAKNWDLWAALEKREDA